MSLFRKNYKKRDDTFEFRETNPLLTEDYVNEILKRSAESRRKRKTTRLLDKVPPREQSVQRSNPMRIKRTDDAVWHC